MPEIIACHLVAGEVDYLLEVVVPDPRTISTLSGRKVAQFADRSRSSEQHRDLDAEGGGAIASRSPRYKMSGLRAPLRDRAQF